MAGPTDPFDPSRPQLPDNAGELTQTLRAIKEVLVDYRTRIEELEESVATNVGSNVGAMYPWGGAGSTPPVGYLFCQGQTVGRDDYPNLFAVIGTTWGVGDGTTTFTLPDFRGRTARGLDTGANRDHEPGRVVGSYQEDTLQNVTGEADVVHPPWYNDIETDGMVEIEVVRAQGGRFTSSSTPHAWVKWKFDLSLDSNARTSDETVMKNAAANWVIKY